MAAMMQAASAAGSQRERNTRRLHRRRRRGRIELRDDPVGKVFAQALMPQRALQSFLEFVAHDWLPAEIGRSSSQPARNEARDRFK